jgi:RND family efflux transporter MFP subunit
MKKLAGILVVALVVGGIITMLMHNKAKSASTARNDKMTTFPVSAATVGKEKIEESLSMVGTVMGNNDIAIVSETQGRVTSVFVKIGDHVSAGSLIAQVDDELKLANFKLAEANYEKTKKDLARNEELFKDRAISESQIEASRLAFTSAESQYIVAKRQWNDTRIKTPIAGVVTSKTIEPWFSPE